MVAAAEASSLRVGTYVLDTGVLSPAYLARDVATCSASSIIQQASGLDDDQLLRLPGVLVGLPAEIAGRLRRYREQHGVSYISVLEPHLGAFAEVIALLR